MRYKQIFVGGTFDGLHRGHQELLRRAFAEGERVTVGLTSDEFVANYKGQNSDIKIFVERKKDLEAWLVKRGWDKKATIVPIDDPYEPAVSLTDLEALVVTAETRKRADVINERRREAGLKELVLLEVPLISAADGQPISSTRLRNGEIDKEGRLVLPDSLRPQLRQPLGRVLTGEAIKRSFEEHRGKLMIAVGDVTTKTLLDRGITPSLAIIDGKVARKPYHQLDHFLKTTKIHRLNVRSGPGYISKKAMQAIESWASQQHLQGDPLQRAPERPWVIEVVGEEDLLTLPAVAYGPVGSVVYYGQPLVPGAGEPTTEGLVEVIVTPEKQQEAIALLDQFTQ